MSLDEFIALATKQVPLPKDAAEAAQRLTITKAALCDLVAIVDSDFLACVAIDSETDALPLGPVRQYWAPSALAEKDKEIAQAEEWAMRAGETAFRNIALRFGGTESWKPHE